MRQYPIGGARELGEVEALLDRYLRLALRIGERQQASETRQRTNDPLILLVTGGHEK